MRINERLTARESAIVRHIIAPGIVNVPDDVELGVELVIRRWESEDAHKRGGKPYLVSRDGAKTLALGLLLNTGGLQIWKALRGDASPVTYTNASSYLCVGSSTTAAAATQTALVAETGRKAMDASFPLVPLEVAGGRTAAAREMVFRSTFGGTDANSTWQEFMVDHAAAASATPLDRFVSNQGTKVAQQVWELTIGLTIT